MSGEDEKTRELRQLLVERGVGGISEVLEELPDIDGALATVAYFDEQPSKSSGLLIHLLRSGEKNGYRRPGERGKPGPGVVTPRLLQAIRGSCNSPNGFTRDEARDMFGAKAKHLRMHVDALIDVAMGAGWQETKPHPAFDPRRSREERVEAYHRLLNGGVVEV